MLSVWSRRTVRNEEKERERRVSGGEECIHNHRCPGSLTRERLQPAIGSSINVTRRHVEEREGCAAMPDIDTSMTWKRKDEGLFFVYNLHVISP
jgi:hypothetical protein